MAEAVSRIEMQVMYLVVYLEKFALTETAGYSWKNRAPWAILSTSRKVSAFFP
jgi:hypothetical protein